MKRRKPVSARRRRDNLAGLTFVSPLAIGLTLFLLFPLVFAVFVSFTDYSMYSEYDFFEFKFQMVGLENYIRAFQNQDFWRGMLNATINSIGVPIGILLALVLTNWLIRYPKGSLFFRTLYYLPTVCGAVIITFIWQWIFTLIPNWLRLDFGIQNVNLLSEKNFLTSMIIMGVWSGFGVSVLLLYSTMKGVDKSLYEAAQLDGANGYNQLIHITVPSISPVIFYIIFTGLIGAYQEFARFQVMGNDSPAPYRIVPVWEIYKQVNSGGDLAYGCALGIILGLFIILLSAIQFAISKLWVHYE